MKASNRLFPIVVALCAVGLTGCKKDLAAEPELIQKNGVEENNARNELFGLSETGLQQIEVGFDTVTTKIDYADILDLIAEEAGVYADARGIPLDSAAVDAYLDDQLSQSGVLESLAESAYRDIMRSAVTGQTIEPSYAGIVAASTLALRKGNCIDQASSTGCVYGGAGTYSEISAESSDGYGATKTAIFDPSKRDSAELMPAMQASWNPGTGEYLDLPANSTSSTQASVDDLILVEMNDPALSIQKYTCSGPGIAREEQLKSVPLNPIEDLADELPAGADLPLGNFHLCYGQTMVRGELYGIATAYYGATSADFVQVHYPYAFTCLSNTALGCAAVVGACYLASDRYGVNMGECIYALGKGKLPAVVHGESYATHTLKTAACGVVPGPEPATRPPFTVAQASLQDQEYAPGLKFGTHHQYAGPGYATSSHFPPPSSIGWYGLDPAFNFEYSWVESWKPNVIYASTESVPISSCWIDGRWRFVGQADILSFIYGKPFSWSIDIGTRSRHAPVLPTPGVPGIPSVPGIPPLPDPGPLPGVPNPGPLPGVPSVPGPGPLPPEPGVPSVPKPPSIPRPDPPSPCPTPTCQ